MSAAYVHGAATRPLLGDTIGGALNRAAARFGNCQALISCHQQATYTYGGLLHAVNRAARALLALGVARGQRVGIWSPEQRRVDDHAVCRGEGRRDSRQHQSRVSTARAGIRVESIGRQRAHCGAGIPQDRLRRDAAAADAGAGQRREPANRFRRARVPALRQVVYIGADPEPGGIAWPEFVEMHRQVPESDLDAREAMLQFDDPINIQYTSGTTGSPKGATLSHHNILNNGFFVGEVLRYTESDRICVPVPFYHCFGWVLGNLAALTHGCAVVIPAEAFDAEDDAARDRGAALHVDLRRADDVHRPAGSSALRELPA